MKFNNGWFFKIGRLFVAVLWMLVAAVMVFLVYGMMTEADSVSLTEGAMIIGCGFLWLHMVAAGFHEVAEVMLLDEGAQVRVLLRKQLVPWNEIRQAGVLWRSSRSGHYNDLVLLKQGGSPRKYKDKTFVLRNEFRFRYQLIHLPYKPEVLAFVRQHYGPLDFDLSDGQSEDCVVVDDTNLFQE